MLSVGWRAEICVWVAYRLFSQTNMTGKLFREAKLRHSVKEPCSAPPSPKRATATLSFPFILKARAEPTARGMDPDTIAEEPIIPTSGSARCMEPPLPRQQPAALP